MKLSLILFITLVSPSFMQAMDEETIAQLYQTAAQLEKTCKSQAETDHQRICNAFAQRDIKTIEKFISKSQNLNQEIVYISDQDKNGENLKLTTLLELAWHNNLPDVISLLREKNVSIEETDTEGNTPLAQALSKKIHDTPTLFLLIQEQIINKKNNKGYTPLHIVLTQSGARLNVINLLVKQGADLELKDNAGNTPIHFASKNASGKILYNMLKSIQDEDKIYDLVNIQNEQGATALHLAIVRYLYEKKEDMHSIALLLQSGAELEIPNKEDITPIQLVKNCLQTELEDQSTEHERAQKLYNFIEKCVEDDEFCNTYLEELALTSQEESHKPQEKSFWNQLTDGFF